MKNKQVCVIGVGFVGEHLVEIFSKKYKVIGYKVIGYDVSEKRLVYLREKFKNNKNVILQSSVNNLFQSDLFCISVPTLIREDGTIDDHYILSAVKLIEDTAK